MTFPLSDVSGGMFSLISPLSPLIIHSDKEFSDDRLDGRDSQTEEGVSGTIVLDSRDKVKIDPELYREYLADEIPAMHQRSSFMAFCADLLEMFSIRKFDSEFDIDDSSISLEASEEEQNTDASSFLDETTVTDLEKNYSILKNVAKGGQGTISSAQDLQFGRKVAIKSLRKPDNQTARHSFFTEARITAHLEHPSIVPIHSLYVDHENAPHLAMKLIEGKSVRERLSTLKHKYATLPWHKICAVERWQRKLRIERFLRVCEAMEYAHNRNVLHRDLKPENIMIGRFGEVYVMDWGMAIMIPHGQDWVVSPICGTPRYISPEVLQHRPYGKTADIYQLGLILYELVFLRRAFPWKNRNQVLDRVKTGEMAPLVHYYGCYVSPTLCNIIARATALSPHDRYQTVSQLARDLRGYLKNEATSVERSPRMASFLRVMGRHSTLLLCLTLFFCVIAFGTVFYSMNEKLNAKQEARQEDETLRRLYSINMYTSTLLEREIRDLENDVISLARETRVRLATLQPPNPSLNYYRGTAGVIEHPPGYGYVPTYDDNDENKVSFRAFFWHLPEHVQLDDLDSILTTLYPMMPSFKRLLTDHFRSVENGIPQKPVLDLSIERTPVLNSRVAFENKLMLAYPYEGNMPVDYDVTTSVWYQYGMNQAKKGTAVWTPPFLSVRVKNRIIIGCSSPIFDNDYNKIGVAVAILAPADFIRLFTAKISVGPYIRAHYLVHASGSIYATDTPRFQPVVENGEISFSNFPYMDKFHKIWDSRLGREFLDEEKNTLFIFNRIEELNCVYIEEIDFKRAMEMDWTIIPQITGSNAIMEEISP